MEDADFKQSVAASLEALAAKPDTPDSSTQDAIKRIEKVVAAARSNWFWFFGILGYAALTLMNVQDADFFSPGKTTTLPILNFDVKLVSFLIFAPALIALVYAYLHGLIDQLWEDLATVPAHHNGAPIAASLPVWLLLEMALLLRRLFHKAERAKQNAPVHTSELGILAVVAVFILIWLAAPFVIGWFWLRSTVLHDAITSFILAGILLFSLLIMWLSLWNMLTALWSLEARDD